jgi:hypothetical protein
VANLSIGTRDAFPLIGFFIGIADAISTNTISTTPSPSAIIMAADLTGGAPVALHIAGELANLSIGTRDAFPLVGCFIGIADATSINTSTTTICISASASANIIAADFTGGAPHTPRIGGSSKVANLSRGTGNAFPLIGFFIGITDATSSNTKTFHNASASASIIATDKTGRAPVTPHMAREVANLSIGTRDAFPLVGLFVRITHRAYIGAKSSFTSGAAKLVTTDKTGGAPVTPHIAREVANLSIGTRDAFPLIGFFIGIADANSINTRTADTSASASIIAADFTGGAPVTLHVVGEVANLSIWTGDAFPLIGFFIGIADATGSNTSTTTICISASTSANIIAAD